MTDNTPENEYADTDSMRFPENAEIVSSYDPVKNQHTIRVSDELLKHERIAANLEGRQNLTPENEYAYTESMRFPENAEIVSSYDPVKNQHTIRVSDELLKHERIAANLEGRQNLGQHVATKEPWYQNEGSRRYLYRVATVVLTILSAAFAVDAVQTQQWAELIGAILNLSVAGATELARSKVKN